MSTDLKTPLSVQVLFSTLAFTLLRSLPSFWVTGKWVKSTRSLQRSFHLSIWQTVSMRQTLSCLNILLPRVSRLEYVHRVSDTEVQMSLAASKALTEV